MIQYTTTTSLEAYRAKLDIGLERLSTSSGVNSSLIWRYENGQRTPNIVNCFKLQRGFKKLTNKTISLDKLFKSYYESHT